MREVKTIYLSDHRHGSDRDITECSSGSGLARQIAVERV
jgi:hypothetical protein